MIMPQDWAFLFFFLLSPCHSFLWSTNNLCRNGNPRDTKGSRLGRRSSILACLLVGCYCGFQMRLKGPCIDGMGPSLCGALRGDRHRDEMRLLEEYPWRACWDPRFSSSSSLLTSMNKVNRHLAHAPCIMFCHTTGPKQELKNGMNPLKAHASATLPFHSDGKLISTPPLVFRACWGWDSTPGLPSELLFLDFIYQRGNIKSWGCNTDGRALA